MKTNIISQYYKLGTKQALFDKLAELTPLEKEYRLNWELPTAATGGLLGGFSGSILGGIAGRSLSHLLDTNERKTTSAGALAGLLLGGGLGSYGGYRLGKSVADEAARRAVIRGVLHNRETEESVRRQLIEQGILSG